MSARTDRRAQRQREKHQKRVAKRAAMEAQKLRDAPGRVRSSAHCCFFFGVLAILGGVLSAFGTPEFGGEAYTEIVARLAFVSGGIAWLAAVVLFVGGALLKALADTLDELRRQTAVIAEKQ